MGDAQGSIDISQAELQALPPQFATVVKSLLNIRQSFYDVFGSYPQANTLPYWYGVALTTAAGTALTALGESLQSIRIAADSAFVATSLVGSSDGDYNLFIRQDSSDRQLSNISVINTALVGTAQRPGFLAKPLLLPANTTISLTLNDLSGAANEVFLFFHGFKVYNRRSS